uniref:NADH-ubiquinone oxidoreductase chain 3 n=1 Tax=Platynereis bicanaliculata TaxID=868042 RepID=A0A7G8JTM8_9ANNE|nr:NADH dehydrogenase subunit 3 [Platynereis bicanaliculata]QNJ33926.1 NADH dehydrogenase subunit 3 [Platynereis bicanaliculata]
MIYMYINFFIAMVFPLAIILATFFLNKKMKSNYEKATPFECGFDPFNSARIPFSLRFFILAVLFLVFDIEIAILMPIPSVEYLSLMIKLILTIFCFILIMGLFHEWNEGSLEWK